MDETAVYLDMPGERTLEETGRRTVLVRTTGHDKDKVTVMLSALGDCIVHPGINVQKCEQL